MAFTVVLEEEIMDALDAEAANLGRRRLPHLREILRERYGLNPDEPPEEIAARVRAMKQPKRRRKNVNNRSAPGRS